MNLNTRPNEHPAWTLWSTAYAFVRQCAASAAEIVIALVVRRAAQRTLNELEHFDDRQLADIGLDRAAFAALLRGMTKQA